ncbi:MAG: RHS repeat-associated core domain-containing protein [Prevotellaceae bacterium]|jgi:RHS repeat-associated protein|nr:RHS repeat-associated core domain-containing protein [Prevotellaceae bacterium]
MNLGVKIATIKENQQEMKQYLFFILLFFAASAFAQFQNVVTKNTTNTTGGEIMAGQCVRLQPGFSFKAKEGKSLRVYIDEQYAVREENTSVSSNKNYIVAVTPLDAALTASFNNGKLDISGNARTLVDIQYFDGLGRPEELVMRGITPDKADLVALQEYDGVGRENKQWLPGAKDGNNGAYVSAATAKSNSMNTVYDVYPYNETVYENSPLNRVYKQFGAGYEWRADGGKAVVTEYLSNTASGDLACPLFEISGTGLLYSKDYAVNTLYVSKITDENGNPSYTFTDKLGKVVMTKQSNAKTCYVYDNFGNLVYVLPPMAVSSISKSATVIANTVTAISNFVYIYKYDERNRCIEKKLPGADWIYYVYDKADRLILSQDGNQRDKTPTKEWTFYEYDALGRLIISGIYRNNNDRSTQANIYKNAIVTETLQHESNTYDKTSYTSSYFSDVPFKDILLINYYDTYEYVSEQLNYNMTDPLADIFISTEAYEQKTSSIKGLLTGTRAKTLDDTGTETATTYFYDNKGRVIQKSEYSENKFEPFWADSDQKTLYSYLNYQRTNEFYKYSFTGELLNKKINYSIITNSDWNDFTETYRYEYDHADRLTKTWHKINDKPEVLMSQLAYDDLGRAIEQKLHNGVENDYYYYNVRNWLEEMYSQDYRFYENLQYDYNGNIAFKETWNDIEDVPKSYEYAYDNLNRLTATYHDDPNLGLYVREGQTYDLNGNINTQQREGRIYDYRYMYYFSETIDDLTFSYNGNQITKITDPAGSQTSYRSQDFKPNSTLDIQYLYDKNGNMCADDNKGIAKIKYNFLNLPDSILFRRGGHLMHYVYDAAGVKHAVEYKTGVGDVNVPLNGTTDASNWNFAHTEREHYAGNLRYTTENGNITSMKLLTETGYAEYNTPNYWLLSDWTYFCNIKDHLGSVVYTLNAETGETEGYTHYYGFGMEDEMEKYGYNPAPGVPSKEKYTGKELQADFGLNLYDYGWRSYDMAMGRFTTIDPLCEKYYSISPYVYCANNPINFVDPDGLDYWHTSDPREIERFLNAVKNEQTYFDATNWGHVTDVDFTANLFFNDETGKAFVSYGMESKAGIIGEFFDTNVSMLNFSNAGYPELDFYESNGIVYNNRGQVVGERGLDNTFPEMIGLVGTTRVGWAAIKYLWNEMKSPMGTTNTFDANKSGFAKSSTKTERKINTKRADVWKEQEIKLRKQLKTATTNAEKNKIKKEIEHAINQQKKSEPHGRTGQGY